MREVTNTTYFDAKYRATKNINSLVVGLIDLFAHHSQDVGRDELAALIEDALRQQIWTARLPWLPDTENRKNAEDVKVVVNTITYLLRNYKTPTEDKKR